MQACSERADMLAARVAKLIALRRSERADRKVAVVLFNFPPNAGSTGTAAFLSVFESLYNTLAAMQRAGYTVELPDDVDALRNAVLKGNADHYGAPANVFAKVSADEHVRRETWLREIEAQWGPAPGRHQTDGRNILLLGATFGNVLVSVQPAMGIEGDPMRLLFDKGFAPTHAFSAFYRYLREDFKADAVLHFGTHGALEFMPGKQAGMTADCWPDRLIGDLPNLYLYASNNPSEGTIAKRRAAATLISYLTPPVAQAGLYKGLVELKEVLERFRGLEPDASGERERTELLAMMQAQALALELAVAEPAWTDMPATMADATVARLTDALLELEYTLIPCGLHVVGQAPTPAERVDLLLSCAEAGHGLRPAQAAVDALVQGATPEAARAPHGCGRPRHTAAGAAGTRHDEPPPGPGARDRRHPPRAGRPLPAPRPRRRPAAHARGAAHGPQPARLRPLPHSQRLRSAGWRAPGRAACWRTTRTTATPSPNRSPWSCGAPTTSRAKAARSPRPWR